MSRFYEGKRGGEERARTCSTDRGSVQRGHRNCMNNIYTISKLETIIYFLSAQIKQLLKQFLQFELILLEKMLEVIDSS